jgi:3-hexulose-6-phosphate synthase/6-phospho-3-hexuloisomerase
MRAHRDWPVLQVALDFTEISRALLCAHEAVEGGADWLEAGTPLIKSEGLEAVRALRREFPDHVIVADMKIMDAGRIEVETAAKAGADIVGVLGVASDATIAECVEAARNYGARIVVDLINEPDPVKRASQVEALGVDYIDVHTPIDVQMRGGPSTISGSPQGIAEGPPRAESRGGDPFETLRRVREAVKAPLGVAGGIHSENAADAVEAGGQIIIVGGAITKSADARGAAAALRQALDTRAKIATELYRRVTEQDIIEVLKKVSAANLSDALHRGGVLPGIVPISPDLRMCGPVLTVRTAPGDWAKPVEAIDIAEPGDVIVIDAGGAGPALWGELATYSALNKQIAGVVIDGAIRDTPEIRKLAFPAFSRLVMPNAGEPRGFGEIGVPIKISGVTVKPGDWILGDADGVVLLPKERAAEYANRAMDVLEKENRIREEIIRGGTLSQVMELLRWEKVG